MTSPAGTPRLLRALSGEVLPRPPVWLMRQAGRYLPEYRALRATTPDFIGFCLDPEKAAEATLQPMRRFPLDAAIVFADILLIPRALGQEVWFEAGEGPRLGELPPLGVLSAHVEQAAQALSPVGETLTRVRAALEPERALIGFAGAPWTVLTYMLEGRSSDRSRSRHLVETEPARIDAMVEVLVEATWRYLAMQVQAGAEVLMLFESWAEGLSAETFERLVTRPHARLIARLRQVGVTAPVVGFPRGAGDARVRAYAQGVPTDAIALDTEASLELGLELQASGRTIQGALDPQLLRTGGPVLDRRVDELLLRWGSGPYIFNLGHGVLPDTPVEHVERMIRQVVDHG